MQIVYTRSAPHGRWFRFIGRYVFLTIRRPVARQTFLISSFSHNMALVLRVLTVFGTPSARFVFAILHALRINPG